MFDNGSIECRNFWIKTAQNCTGFEWAQLKHRYPKLIDSILGAFEKGETWRSVGHINVIDEVNDLILEVSWD